MKKVFSVLMSFLFLLVISQQAVVITHFKLNQKALTDKYCINKDNPELQCNGKCHLNKELEQTKNTNSEKINNYKNFDLVLSTILEFVPVISKEILTNAKSFYRVLERLAPYLEVFVPPPIFSFSIWEI